MKNYFAVLALLPCLSFAGEPVSVERYAKLGELNVACAEGVKDSCEEANTLEAEIEGLQGSQRCAERKIVSDALLCGFVDGYLAGSISPESVK